MRLWLLLRAAVKDSHRFLGISLFSVDRTGKRDRNIMRKRNGQKRSMVRNAFC